MKTKSEIRRTLLEARRAMPGETAAAKNARRLEKLKALPQLLDAEAVLCYVSSKDNEADTHPLIEWLLERGKMVLVPIAGPERRLEWSRIVSFDDLAPARFGILEPRPECRRIMPPPGNAVVIVPGIAFTRHGYRIGYGGGFYDTFLARHHGAKIAVAFDMQIIDVFDRAEHDAPVDWVVTETEVFARKGGKQ